jgi:hypothetical protein
MNRTEFDGDHCIAVERRPSKDDVASNTPLLWVVRGRIATSLA